MAAAIDKATKQDVDVVTLSMGGLPSGALRDAVNGAYEGGTAIFAASGDFFKIPHPAAFVAALNRLPRPF